METTTLSAGDLDRLRRAVFADVMMAVEQRLAGRMPGRPRMVPRERARAATLKAFESPASDPFIQRSAAWVVMARAGILPRSYLLRCLRARSGDFDTLAAQMIEDGLMERVPVGDPDVPYGYKGEVYRLALSARA